MSITIFLGLVSIFTPLHQSRESAKAVDRCICREAVHAAQAAARASLSGIVLACACDDGSSSAGTSSALSSHAASLDGNGGRGSSGVGVDVLEAAGLEGSAVCGDGESLEVGHCLVAGGGGVDAEDHAFAAVDTVLLFAVEPWDNVLVLRQCKVGIGIRRTKRLSGGDSHVPCDTRLALGVGHETRIHSSFHLSAGIGKG
jgi:hypothetical protein